MLRCWRDGRAMRAGSGRHGGLAIVVAVLLMVVMAACESGSSARVSSGGDARAAPGAAAIQSPPMAPGLPTPTPGGPVAGITVRPADGSLAAGGTTTARVAIDVPLGIAVGVYTVDVQYDPAVLRATDCATASGAGSGVCNATYKPNQVRFAGILPPPGLTGSGTLGEITFAAAGRGQSALTIALAEVSDAEGNPLPTPSRPEPAAVQVS